MLAFSLIFVRVKCNVKFPVVSRLGKCGIVTFYIGLQSVGFEVAQEHSGFDRFFFTGFPRLLESPGFFVVENSRTWKDLENHLGHGKSWKNSLKVMHFSSGSNGKQAAIV